MSANQRELRNDLFAKITDQYSIILNIGHGYLLLEWHAIGLQYDYNCTVW